MRGFLMKLVHHIFPVGLLGRGPESVEERKRNREAVQRAQSAVREFKARTQFYDRWSAESRRSWQGDGRHA